MNKLIKQMQIIQLNKMHKQIIQYSHIDNHEKDHTIQMALDSKNNNLTIYKNKFQLPNTKLFLDNIEQTVKLLEKNHIVFSSIGL